MNPKRLHVTLSNELGTRVLSDMLSENMPKVGSSVIVTRALLAGPARYIGRQRSFSFYDKETRVTHTKDVLVTVWDVDTSTGAIELREVSGKRKWYIPADDFDWGT